MKKKFLLMTALAVLCGLGVKAQTWTPQAPADGDFYLYNVGTGTFLSCGEDWGTLGVVGNGALKFTLENNGSGAYTLYTTSTFSYGNPNSAQLQSSGYVDQNVNATTWTFTPVNGLEKTYTLLNAAGTYLYAPSDGTIKIILNSDAPTGNNGYWKLIDYDHLFENATELNPVDVTCLIGDANFESSKASEMGWTMVASNQNLSGGSSPNKCAESYQSAFTLSRTITVPNGNYQLLAQAALTEYNVTGNDLPVVYLNEETTPFCSMTEGESSMSKMSEQFTADKYHTTPLVVTVTNNTLTLGVRGTRTDTWCIWDNFQLFYLGVDLTALRDALQAQIDAVPDLEGTTTTAAYNYAKSYADGINVSSLTTEVAIGDAATELSNRVNAAKNLVAAYSRYKNVRTAVLAIDNGIDVSAANTAVEDATTVDGINDAVTTLRSALLAALPNLAIPVAGYIDVTAALVDNASVRQNTDYWTIEGTPNTNYSWAKCANNECEFYQQNFKFYQTLTLTPGTWEFGVTGFHREGNHNTHFYAGEDKTLIPGVANSVVNSMTEAETYFDGGNGQVALKFLIEAAGDVEIGIDNQDTQTDKWTIFRDFTLKYYGAPDYTVYENQWEEKVTEANTAKTNHSNVTGTELTALNAAIADSPAGSNLKATYMAKIDALDDALAAFNAAAPAYDKYVAYRDETVALWGSDLGVTAPTTAAEALVAVQNLNIAQYNKVATDYPYSLTSKIGDFSTWTGTAEVGTPRVAGTPNSLSWEHWSGVDHPYYEQDASGYDNVGGWTIQYTKTTTLPAGSYVVKVAARSSAGVTSSVTCTALPSVTISLPCEGNNTRGINAAGEASWDAGDTFISTGGKNASVGGTGAGWQWRFLPFTLAVETEVTMTFYAEASTASQWMSIGDGELLSATDIATVVAYNESTSNTIDNVDVANVNMNRTIKVGFNTVCLPFTLTANQVTAAFGTGTEVYEFSETSTDPNDVTINFNKVAAGTISANVPVLVNATAASSEQVFNGVQVVAAAEAKVEGTNVDFVGVYAPETIIAGNCFIGNGAVYKSEGSTSINAFRAYLSIKNASSAPRMFIDGHETTGIDLVEVVKTNDVIYNLNGQRVENAQKGIYIVNGKKVVIK